MNKINTSESIAPQKATTQSTQPSHAPSNAVCSVCGYNIGGVESDQEQRVTCPECGTTLKPAPANSIYTKKQIHRLYMKMLIIPSVIASIIVFLVMLIPGYGLLFFIPFFLLAPLVQLVLYLSTISTALKKSQPHPRPCPRWHIPFTAFIACLPGLVMYICLFLFAGQVF